MKLRGAALSKAITGFVRDDTEKNPVRYPLYATYLICISTPLPFFGASTLILAATALWASKSKSVTAQDLNGRIRAAFNDAALVCDHKDYITPHPEKEDKFRIKNGGLAWHTTKRAANDSWQATKTAFSAGKEFLQNIIK